MNEIHLEKDKQTNVFNCPICNRRLRLMNSPGNGSKNVLPCPQCGVSLVVAHKVEYSLSVGVLRDKDSTSE